MPANSPRAASSADDLEARIEALLADASHENHPLREALAELMERHQDHLTQLERMTSISDGYQSVQRDRNHSLSQRYQKQLRQLQKIVRISDHYQKMMRELNEKLQVLSTHDPLTGLANRRLMLDRLAAEVALSMRCSRSFSLLAVDIDHFKKVNDDFGHGVGDLVLVGVAKSLSQQLRAYDVCARWGGEEFLILLPEISGSIAHEVGDRLRRKIEGIQYEGAPAGLSLTLSIGVAEHRCTHTADETIRRADHALYAAKHAGRNRVVLAPSGED